MQKQLANKRETCLPTKKKQSGIRKEERSKPEKNEEHGHKPKRRVKCACRDRDHNGRIV